MPQPTGTSNKPKATKPAAKTRVNTVSLALTQVYRNTSKWNAFCLPLLGTLIFLFAVALIVIGATQGIEDLYIIGGIFIFGSFIFFFLLYINVCRPMCKRNQVSYEEQDDQFGSDFVKSIRVPKYLNDYDYSDDEDNLKAANKPVPTESQLYGMGKSRSFLATPATTKDVNFMDEDMGTPPPPRVKSALHRIVTPPPGPFLPEGVNGISSPTSFSETINEHVRKLETRDLDLK